jgi:hypothetical protein
MKHFIILLLLLVASFSTGTQLRGAEKVALRRLKLKTQSALAIHLPPEETTPTVQHETQAEQSAASTNTDTAQPAVTEGANTNNEAPVAMTTEAPVTTNNEASTNPAVEAAPTELPAAAAAQTVAQEASAVAQEAQSEVAQAQSQTELDAAKIKTQEEMIAALEARIAKLESSVGSKAAEAGIEAQKEEVQVEQVQQEKQEAAAGVEEAMPYPGTEEGNKKKYTKVRTSDKLATDQNVLNQAAASVDNAQNTLEDVKAAQENSKKETCEECAENPPA